MPSSIEGEVAVYIRFTERRAAAAPRAMEGVPRGANLVRFF